jgi:tyrosyl-tRNA synthetase
VIISAFELCTNVLMPEITALAADLKKDKVNPRDLKMKLAWEITKINHGETEADKAQENFVKTIQKKEMPLEVPIWKAAKDEYDIVELLAASGLAASKSEARRFVEQGAIKIKQDNNWETIKDARQAIIVKKEIIIQRGKLHFIRVKR